MIEYYLVVISLAVFIIYDLIIAVRKSKEHKKLVVFPLRLVLLAIIAYIVLNDLFILMDISNEMPYILD